MPTAVIMESGCTALLLSSKTPISIIDKIRSRHEALELLFRPSCDFKPGRAHILLSKFNCLHQSLAIEKCPASVHPTPPAFPQAHG